MFGAKRPAEMQGLSLLDHLDKEKPGRDAVIFGYFGGAVNITDGRYTYHCYPSDLQKQEIYQYTLMPTHIWELFSTEELADATLSPPLPFTKNCPVLRTPHLSIRTWVRAACLRTTLACTISTTIQLRPVRFRMPKPKLDSDH